MSASQYQTLLWAPTSVPGFEYAQYPGEGTSHMKGMGILVRSFEETDLGVAQAFFDP